MRVLPSLPLLLAGCAFGLQPTSGSFTDGGDADTDIDADADADADSDSDSDTDSDTDSDVNVKVENIDPAYGTTAGGTTVLIEGTFLDDVSVRFGGVEATVLSVDEAKGEARVRTPAQAGEGAVAVVVSSGSDSKTVDEGFTYYADGTGLAGVIGTMTWVDIVGSYWADPPIDEGYSWFFFNTPLEFDWGEIYASGLDQCQSEYTWSGTIEDVYDPGSGATATVGAGAKSIDYTWNRTDVQFDAGTLSASGLTFGGDYDLTGFAPTSDLPAFTMSDLVSMPQAFSVSAPRVDSDVPPQVSEGFSLAWTHPDAADGVLVQLQLRGSNGTSVQESVSCWLRDDGAHNVPANVWNTQWAAGRQLDIFVTRYTAGSGTVPFNNADSAMAGEYIVYGAAFTK